MKQPEKGNWESTQQWRGMPPGGKRHAARPSPEEPVQAGGGDIDRLQLRDLRARFLALEGDAAIEIHGWLLGVACAVERQRGSDPRAADRLIAELRASKGPPDWSLPVICPKCDWPASCCGCSPQSSIAGDDLDKAPSPGTNTRKPTARSQFTGDV
jgi:hypothetical protein